MATEPSNGSQPDPFLNEKEWLPLWAIGPVLALVATIGLIGLLMLAAVLYGRLAG